MEGTDSSIDAGNAGVSGSKPEPEKPSYISWPPPGLEAAQGKLWTLITLLAVGDFVLLAPLLWSVATEQELWSFGPFGISWWVPLVTSTIGLIVLFNGLAQLFGLLKLAARAGKRGHCWHIVLQVAADAPRDTGFLLLGARIYSDMTPASRARLLQARMLGAAGYLFAVLWVPFGFVVGILLGTRGLASPAGVWFLALGPSSVALLAGIAGRAMADSKKWLAKRNAELRTAVDQEISDQVSTWNSQLSPIGTELGIDVQAPGRVKPFRVGAVLVVILGFLIAIPVATISFTGAVGNVIAAIAVPNFSRAHARANLVELLRDYQLEPTGDVSATHAGEALHSLLSVTPHSSDRWLEQDPVRVYDQEWFPANIDSILEESEAVWAMGLFERSLRSLSATEREVLDRVSMHPAHAEFPVVASAGSADIIGTRYELPLPDSVTPFELPIPSLRGVHQAVGAHFVLAARELYQGRPRDAERMVREVVSVGFVLIDDGPSALEGMIGTRLVENGSEALEHLFRATGRSGEADQLKSLREGIEEALDRAVELGTAVDAQSALQQIPSAVLNESVMKGLRWELFLIFNTLAPCVNMNKVVFGTGESYEWWLQEAESVLVESESDAEMFNFLREGWFGGAEYARVPLWLRATIGFTFGSSQSGSCMAQLAGLDFIDVI